MRTADGTTYYYMYNGHADVTALLKPDGTIAATYYYDAFGNITDTTGAASNTITFAGYQYDKETGLYYLNARMYDPKTARFLQEDTYTGDRNDPLSLNLYTYCHNEPLMYSDPTGHMADYDAMKLHLSMIGTTGSLDKIKDSGILDPNTREYLKQAKTTYTKNKIAQVNKEEREVADRRNWPQDGSVSEGSSGAWTSLKNSFGEYWSNVKVNTAAGWEDIKSDISNRIENTKNSFINYGNEFKNAFSSWNGFKDASLGVGSSIANGGLNTARIVLTAMSCQPNNTWNQLGSNIDWANEKIQTNLVTDPNTYQTFSTFADAGQMAWGAGGLYKMFKGGIGLPSFSNSPSYMDAGTGMRISGVPDDFGRMNVSPINRGVTGVSEVKGVTNEYRNASLREIKRQLDIPMSQQPIKQEMVPLRDMNGNRILNSNNQPVMSRELIYDVNGKKIVVQDHSAGHDFGGIGDQPSHHNVRPIENTDTGKVEGMEKHYYFNKRNR